HKFDKSFTNFSQLFRYVVPDERLRAKRSQQTQPLPSWNRGLKKIAPANSPTHDHNPAPKSHAKVQSTPPSMRSRSKRKCRANRDWRAKKCYPRLQQEKKRCWPGEAGNREPPPFVVPPSGGLSNL